MSWEEVPLFTVGNPGVSSGELAARARRQLAAETPRVKARRTRKEQGKPEQIVLKW